MSDKNKERLLELLADQAIFGLTEEESMELQQLKTQFSELEQDVSFELTAAAVNLADLDSSVEMPANLRAKISDRAGEYFNQPDSRKNVLYPAPGSAETEPKGSSWQWLSWTVAVAACVTLAIILWQTRTRPQPEIVNKNSETVQTPEKLVAPESIATPVNTATPEIVGIPEPVKTPETAESNKTPRNQETTRTPETNGNQGNIRSPKTANNPVAKTPEIVRPTPVKTPPPELTAAQRREQLLASAPDIIQTNWVSAKDKKVVLGDIVWSSAQQKGYIRVRGMPALDPSQETYQLWIVDEAQSKKTPVSGGIFNVGQAGEVVIPINAQLRILKPKSFAISKEKAGGVVVTKPDRIVATAKL